MEILKKIKIRYAVKKDESLVLQGIKEICTIEKEKPDKIMHLRKQFRKSIKKKEIIVAVLNKESIGYLWFLVTNKVPYGVDYGKVEKYCWLNWSYVLKRYRNKGIGSLLLRTLLQQCKKRKIKEIFTDVYRINKKSKKFHEKRGFKPRIEILEQKIK